jgi:hypothetical protein
MCLTLAVNNSYTITTKNLTVLMLFFQLYIMRFTGFPNKTDVCYAPWNEKLQCTEFEIITIYYVYCAFFDHNIRSKKR